MSNRKDLLKILNNLSEDNIIEDKQHDRIILIDGLNMFLRNFAVINHINPTGNHVGGLGGFLRSLGYLINQIQPTSVYIVFDGIGSSLNRKSLLPEYKSGRNLVRINQDMFDSQEDEDESKINQVIRLVHYLRCLPVNVVSIDKVEADDIIAYYSDYLPKAYGSKVYIVSNDKDYLQLINENVIVYRPADKEFYNKETIKNKFGILAENFIIYKTLLGDNSDKIPGVKGLGEKGVFKRFPELKNQIINLEDLFEICISKHKEHHIYSQIVFSRNNLERNYKLMDLKNPLVDENEKIFLEEITKQPIPELNVEGFLHLYNEDGLNHIIKNTDYWLKETFKLLNSFKK
jgi:5'-3' exonuclease